MKNSDDLARRHSPMVLIIAPADDAHACVVAKRLEALDAEPIVLNLADFPREWQLSVSYANDESPRFVLRRGSLELHEENLLGVWWRRARNHVPSGDVQEPHLRRLVSSESRAAFEGWLHCLSDRLINPVAANRTASFKLLQLRCANSVGLRIPRSLATNSPEEARSFFHNIGPNTVYKPFTATDWTLFATNRISPDAAEHLDAVSYAPVIFQEEIRKVADIRVNILDGQIFALLIQQPTQNAPIDWRIDPGREYLPHSLPEQTKAGLLALMDRLGLRFAACDLGLTEAGEYVFFEANPGGQWLFAEIMADQPISWAFAHALLGRERPPIRSASGMSAQLLSS